MNLQEPIFDEEAYYRYTLDMLFTHLGISAYVLAARWSELEKARNPLVFAPGIVGQMAQKRASSLTNHFNKHEIRRAIYEFSFTRLLVENGREVWFHFSKADPDERLSTNDEIYLRPLETEYKTAQCSC